LPRQAADAVILEYPKHGGHVGFVRGNFPGALDWLPRRIVRFFSEQVQLQDKIPELVR
jgi:predicted alpha/beta-fold hydrolase